MITLYGSGPNFGLPDASPFVTKAETLLRMSTLPFEKALMSFSKAPKGNIPYIEDDGQLLGDSTLIRWHLEKKYGIDFDQGLTAEQLAIAWAFEKMAEDNLYWANVYFRWMIDANFRKGPVLSSRAYRRRSGPSSFRWSAGGCARRCRVRELAVIPPTRSPRSGSARSMRWRPISATSRSSWATRPSVSTLRCSPSR